MKKNQNGDASNGKVEDEKENELNKKRTLLKNTKIEFNHYYPKSLINKVMMNQFDNCACFYMNPDKPDFGAQQVEQRQKELVWITFKKELQANDLSAETISHMFASIGDYQIYKDT